MTLQRRLTLYLFGILLGSGVAYWFYGDRLTNSGWLPQEKIRQRLRSTLTNASPDAREAMAAWPVDLPAVRASMDSATIDLKASQRTDDSIHYVVYGHLAGRSVRYTVSVLRDFDRDTTATLRALVPR